MSSPSSPRPAAVVRSIHVPAVAEDLVTTLDHAIDAGRDSAQRDACRYGKGRLDAVTVEGLQDTEDAHPVAVLAQREVAQVRVRRRHATGRRERLALLVQREELQCHVDPQGQALAAGPCHGLAIAEHGPVVADRDPSRSAMWVLEVGLDRAACRPPFRSDIGQRRVVTVVDVVLGDLPARGDPDVRMAGDVLERLFERP